jgi:O-antigen ligase
MLAKLKHTYLKFGYNLPLLIAFFLPFGLNYAVFILIWSFSFFLFDDVKAGFKVIFKNKWSFIVIGFFFLHVIGYFFSENKSAALSAIEIKLCFLAFPILFFGSHFNNTQVKKIVISYVSGCMLVSFLCIFRACYIYFFEDTNAFFYSDFSYFIHPSYMAMYLVFALLIVMLFYKKWLAHLQLLNLKLGFMAVIFLVTIFLCSSKMGLLTAFILLPTTFSVILYNKGYKKTIIGLVIALLGLATVSYKLFPTPFKRFQTAINVTKSSQTIDKTDAESTAVRILIWKESIKLIQNNFWFGTTAGDVNDKLIESYETEGLLGALAKKLNAHNQFLQTCIGTGFIGFVLLILMTVFLIVYSFIKKNYILMLFSILISLNFMVESMLQTQAGFTFFTLFLCLILKYNLKEVSES